MRRTIAGAAIAVELVAGCAGSSRPAAQPPNAHRSSASMRPVPTAEPSGSGAGGTIRLPHLPLQGIAIGHQGASPRVTLVGVRGQVLDVLPGFSIAHPAGPPLGPLVLARGSRRYRLRPRRHALVPTTRSGPRVEAPRRFPLGALPEPSGSTTSGEPNGEWTSGVLSFDGTSVLAEWTGFVFGSCQTTASYLMRVEGGRPVPVTGAASIERRPTSFAIGWTRTGRALAFLPGVGCAGPERVRAGVYRFAAPGRGTRIAGGNAASFVRMWGARAGGSTRATIRLAGSLPPRGVAVERRGGVRLVSIAGRTLATLRSFSIDRATDRPGALVLVRGSARYLVRPGRSAIVRITRRRAEALRRTDDPSVPLRAPAGARVDGQITGHWRWMQRAPTGSAILAQWSGECETPVAMLGVGRSLRPVTGERSLRGAPESFALGWTGDGRAVALLPQGACGSSAERPGVYVFRRPGIETLLVGTRAFAGARMWTPADGRDRP